MFRKTSRSIRAFVSSLISENCRERPGLGGAPRRVWPELAPPPHLEGEADAHGGSFAEIFSSEAIGFVWYFLFLANRKDRGRARGGEIRTRADWSEEHMKPVSTTMSTYGRAGLRNSDLEVIESEGDRVGEMKN